MKLQLSLLAMVSCACCAFGAGEPAKLSDATRWFDFSDPAYYTVDGSGNVLTVIDRSGKINPAVPKVEGKYGKIATVDGKPALDLGAVGSEIDYAFTRLSGHHTLFMVQALEPSGNVFLLGDTGSCDFCRGPNGEYANATTGNLSRSGTGIYDGGMRVDSTGTVIPAGRRLITIAYTPGNASGTFSSFGTDRANGATCSGGKRVCEVIAFTLQLTAAERHEIEAYLAAKWGLDTSSATAQNQVRVGTSTSLTCITHGDVVFAAGSELTVDSPSASVTPFQVNGELSFASGMASLPVNVDATALLNAGNAAGSYPLISWTSLQPGLDASSFALNVIGGSDDYVFTPVCSATGLSLQVARASDWIYHDLSTGALTCASGSKYWISGSGANAVNVPANATVRLRFDNATIAQPANTSCVVIGAGAQVTMENLGTSAFSTATANGKSAIELANSANTRLHFIAGTGTMTLTANGGSTSSYGGCGIYVPELAEFEMDATNTTINANGGYKAAGVGSRMTVPSGRIIINAGTLTATTPGQSACIGTGCQDNQNGATCKYVKITGGTVTANNAQGYGAAIGTGGPYNANSGRLEYFEMTGGTLTAIGKGGAAIGSGPCFNGKTSGSVGTIKISGGTLNLTADNHDYATPAVLGTGGERGNGTGGSGAFENIEISGGTVNIKGNYSCGIGAGWGNKRNVKSATNQGVVRISGGLVNISLTNQRWAIGGPEEANAANKNLSRIEITGGNLYANAPMQIQPVNGVDHGDRPVYDANVAAQWVVVTGVVSSLDYPYSVEYAPGGLATANGDGMAHVWLPTGAYPYGDGKTEYDVSTPEDPQTHDMSTCNVRLCKASRGAVLTSGGAETARDIRVNDKSGAVVFTLSNCVIKAACPYNSEDAAVSAKLTLEGENQLTATGGNSAAFTVPAGGSLVVDGDGKLTTTGGSHAAAIGGGGANSCGNITINGGTIVANGGGQAAGIGTGVSDGGEDRTTGDFVINGGTVTAIAGGNQGAGIGGAMAWKGKGGSLKSYTQTGGSVTASGATGVGGGGGGSQGAYDGGWCGPVKITGGTLTASSTAAPVYNYIGAAIGGGGCRHASGKAGYLVSYEQTGGTVVARGKRIGIGGGGRDPANQNFLACDTTVKITGGTLEATGSVWSIGGEETGDTPVNLKRVEITGGCVHVPNGIQTAPVDANGTNVWLGVFKKTSFADPTNVRLEYKDGGPVYTYVGAGIEGDDRLYFYLPNGSFKAGRGTWNMTDGVLRYTGAMVVFVR